jgi:tetratricopeptide (TPR) repeat protein
MIRSASLLLALCCCALNAHATIEEAQKFLADYRAAQGELQQALSSQDSTAYEALGKKSTELLASARKAYEEAGAATNSDPSVVLSYAEVIKLAGDDDLGAEMVRHALDTGVESPSLWRIYGEMCIAMGPAQYAVGFEALRQSTNLDGTSPESAEAWFALGHYYLMREMPEPAAAAFASALKAKPDHVAAQLGEAVVQIYRGDVAASGNIIEKVGRAAQPYDIMMRTLIRAALQDYERSRRTFSDTVENHYAYARLMYLAARFPEAILAAKRAGHLAPDRTDILNFLGAIQIQMGDLPGAIEAYETSLRAKADQPSIQQTLDQLKKAQEEEARKTAPVGGGLGPLR